MDDDGARYSSLADLTRLPVDELESDRSCVATLATGTADGASVASTIGPGHSLGLRVTVEGGEDRAPWDRRAALECDRAQGYDVGRPLPVDAGGPWLEASLWTVVSSDATP